MRSIFAVLVLVLALPACARAEGGARRWSEAALADLEIAAAAAPAEGLPEETAALSELSRFAHLAETDPAADLQLEIAADTLFASLAHSFAQGGADPARGDGDWRIPRPPAPDLAALEALLDAGARPSAVLQTLLPQTDEYRALRAELARVGAEPAETRDANGLSKERRIGALRANLERWRWLPRDLPARRLEVRLAQYEMRLVRADTPPLTHAVIVGAPQTPTPSFQAEVRTVTLNPSWEPPASITLNELVPRFRRDPDAAVREGFDVIGADGEVVAPSAVDWGARPFRDRLRQRPGPANALGRIRFDMPNAFAIYLHDTPSRTLFNRSVRALSHGCIRVQDPGALAEAVLAAPEWSVDALNRAIDTGATQTVALAQALPIYLVYLTATTEADGTIVYADDIYRRDGAVVAALDGPDVTLARQGAAAAVTCAG